MYFEVGVISQVAAQIKKPAYYPYVLHTARLEAQGCPFHPQFMFIVINSSRR